MTRSLFWNDNVRDLRRHMSKVDLCYLFSFLCPFSMACRNLVSPNMGVRFRIPLQKLHSLSRAIHHRYSGNTNPQRPPHRTAARYFTSMSRLPMRPPKAPSGSGGRSYQQQRNFWVARLAARLLKLRYILLGTAVGGGYTAKKVSIEPQNVSTFSDLWICSQLSHDPRIFFRSIYLYVQQ